MEMVVIELREKLRTKITITELLCKFERTRNKINISKYYIYYIQ
jgi:hypothetical protein